MGDDPRYKRLVIKLSGESLTGRGKFGIDGDILADLGRQMKRLHDAGVEIGLVVGGGNIFRGFKASQGGMNRVTGDHMGMLATVINSLAFQDTLEKLEVNCRVMSAVRMDDVVEPYTRRRAMHHLRKRRLIIMAGGTGNPYFTTDTAAALRAAEIGAGMILKGTRVDGVFSADPEIDNKAVFYQDVSYIDVLAKQLKVMDAASIALCRDNNIPITVFNIHKEGNLYRAGMGERVGTLVH
jgi:uridylate kinase